MKVIGRFVWFVALVVWIITLANSFVLDDRLRTIDGMCLVIGLMLIGNRMIDDSK